MIRTPSFCAFSSFDPASSPARTKSVFLLTLLLILPSDHEIGDETGFLEAIAAGVGAAQRGQIVTFGTVWPIPPFGPRHESSIGPRGGLAREDES